MEENKKAMEVEYTPFADAWRGKAVLYNYFMLRLPPETSTETPSVIKGVYSTCKIQTTRKFLMDGKYCKLCGESIHVFKADELDVEFFKVAEVIPGRKWKVWDRALAMLKSRKDREKVLEYLQTEAVAEKLLKS